MDIQLPEKGTKYTTARTTPGDPYWHTILSRNPYPYCHKNRGKPTLCGTTRRKFARIKKNLKIK